MKIYRYDIKNKKKWDIFLESCKNKHFMFFRDYMEYHSDRFDDFSLIIEDNKGKVISLLPANIKDDIVYSHQGLTFGGFLINDSMKVETMLKIFDLLTSFLKQHSIIKLIYKCIPHIYHTKPSEEDRYALFRHKANLYRRDVTTTIQLSEGYNYSSQRERSIKKGYNSKLDFNESSSLSEYWGVLTGVLIKQYDTNPTHNFSEISKLKEIFPDNIKLFTAEKDNEIIAGVVVFETEVVAHTQYLANSIEGRKIGALDFIIDNLIKKKYANKKFFDFGISNENSGLILNSGLISQKEGFGASAVSHDFYELDLL